MYKDTLYCDVQIYSVLRGIKIECIAMYKDTVHCDVPGLKGIAMYKDTVHCDEQR